MENILNLYHKSTIKNIVQPYVSFQLKIRRKGKFIFIEFPTHVSQTTKIVINTPNYTNSHIIWFTLLSVI